VVVEEGQTVAAGDVIAQVGGSGEQEGGPRLLFELRYHTAEGTTPAVFPIDPYLAPHVFFEDPAAYTGDSPQILETIVSSASGSGFTRRQFELPAGTDQFLAGETDRVYVSFRYGGWRDGDDATIEWIDPGGNVVHTDFDNKDNFATDADWGSESFDLPANPTPGIWSIEITHQQTEQLLATTTFTVGSGASDIRIFTAVDAQLDPAYSGETSIQISDGRTTPVEIGSTDDVDAQTDELNFTPREFSVRNQGTTPLTVTGYDATEGFTVSGFTGTLAALEIQTFTVSRDFGVSSDGIGEVRIFSDDADESTFEFAVGGPAVLADNAAQASTLLVRVAQDEPGNPAEVVEATVDQQTVWSASRANLTRGLIVNSQPTATFTVDSTNGNPTVHNSLHNAPFGNVVEATLTVDPPDPDGAIGSVDQTYVYDRGEYQDDPENDCGVGFGDIRDAQYIELTDTSSAIGSVDQSYNVSSSRVRWPPLEDFGIMSVNAHSGEYEETVTDLEIAGRGFNWRFERTYRSAANFETALGQSWDFADNRRIVEINADNSDLLLSTFTTAKEGDVLRFDGRGRADIYSLNADGTYGAPTEFYTALEKLGDGTFSERDSSGAVAVYDVVDGFGDGKLLSISDRNDNTLSYSYDDLGNLDFVTDTLGRVIDYRYDLDGHITEIEDFSGRIISFEYDANDDLVAVTSPAVTDTSTGNNFAEGRTTRYAYSSGNADVADNHNLEQIIRPNEVAFGDNSPYITLTYDNATDRVTSQTWGGTNANGVEAGGTMTYDYQNIADPTDDPTVATRQLVVTDRAGNVSQYQYNSLGNVLNYREFTSGIRPDDPTFGDPDFFETTFVYNGDGQLEMVLQPEGNFTTTEYTTEDAGTDDRFQQGNATRTVQVADADRGGDQTEIVTERRFEPIYNQLRQFTDPRGTDGSFESPVVVEELDASVRYTTSWFFDYQESDQLASDALAGAAPELVTTFNGLIAADADVLTTEVLLVHELGLDATADGLNTLRGRLTDSGVELGLGDINGDGDTSAIVAGNVVSIVYPTVNLLNGSNQSAIEGDTSQQIVEQFRFNRFGQLTSRVDAEGNLTRFEYYSESNPNADNLPGEVIDNPDGAPDTGGYLRRTIIDATPESSDPTRNSGSGAEATNIVNQFVYDTVGHLVTSVDGRGIVTEFEINELDEVVSVTSAAGHNSYTPDGQNPDEPIELTDFAYESRFFYDYNGNVVLQQVEDRGNTSSTDGNIPDAELSEYLFQVRSTSSGGNTPATLADTSQTWQINEWIDKLVRIEDGAGAGQVRTVLGNIDSTLFVDSAWDVTPDDTSVYAILPNPDAAGGKAYAETAFKYNINDNVIETLQEVDNNTDKFLRTRFRYDANDNLVLTILPEGNSNSTVFDERDLVFQSATGALAAPAAALLAADDPISFDVRGGEPCLCTTFYYDLNGNVVAVGDSEDTDGDASNNVRVSATDPTAFGDATTFTYDGFDRRVLTTDAMGNVTRVNYDPAGNVTRSIRDGAPLDDQVGSAENVTLSATEFIHDELNRQIAVQELLFETPGVDTVRDARLVDGDAMDKLLSQSLLDDLLDEAPIADAIGLEAGLIGRVTNLTEYDRNSRVTFRVEDDLVNHRTEYDGANRAVRTTDSALSTGYIENTDELGVVTSVGFDPTQLAGNTTERTYDDNSNVIESLETDISEILPDDPEQFRTTYFYDSLNRRQTTVNNIGQTSDMRYDSRSNLVAMSDAQGPTENEFGSEREIRRRGLGSDDVVTDTNLFGNVTTFAYDGVNRQTVTERVMTASGDGDGVHIGATIEGVRSLTPTADINQGGGDGLIRTGTVYDDNSLTSAKIDDQGNVSLWLYDNLNRVVAETKGLTVGTDLSEDLVLGDRVIVTPTAATLNAPSSIDESLIDAQLEAAESRLEAVADLFPGLADSIDDSPPTTIVYGYDPDSNLRIVEDENDTETFTQFDANNRATAVRVFRAGQNDSHLLDPDFAPNPTADASNPTDTDNLPTVVGTTRQNFSYDGLSRRTSASDNNGPETADDDTFVTHTFDSLSRVVEETQLTGSGDANVISSGWTSNDRRTSLIYADGRELVYTYDTLDRLKTISDVVPQPSVETFSVAATGSSEFENRAGFAVQNGDFIILPNFFTFDPLQDGVDESTLWRLNYADTGLQEVVAADPDTEFNSATLTLQLRAGDAGISNDLLQIDLPGVEAIISTAIQSLPVSGPGDAPVTIEIDLLETYSSGMIIAALEATNYELPFRLSDDALVSFAQLDLVVGDPADVIPAEELQIVNYDYIGRSRVLNRTYANGTQTTLLNDDGTEDIGYDGLRRVVQTRDLRDVVTIVDDEEVTTREVVVGFGRTYDRANNVLSERKLHDAANSELYEYDSAYRLTNFDRGVLNAEATEVTATGETLQPQNSDWSLDGTGNWDQVDGETRDFSSFNEITTRTDEAGNITQLTYDDNGNLTSDGDMQYEYDFRNRLVRATRAATSEVVAEYTYDASNHRLQKVVTNSGTLDGTTEFVYDGNRAIEERDAAGIVTQQYVYGRSIDEVLVMDRNLDGDSTAQGEADQRLFYHQNPLGSVYAVTDDSGATAEGYAYDAYGQAIVYTAGVNGVVDFSSDDVIVTGGASTLANPYLFTGRRLDAETGLYYYRNRYMDTELGRFIQRDPLGVWTDATSLGNGYLYASSRPNVATDPFGLFVVLEYGGLLGGGSVEETSSGSAFCSSAGGIISNVDQSWVQNLESADVSGFIGSIKQQYTVGPPIAHPDTDDYPQVTRVISCIIGGDCVGGGVPIVVVSSCFDPFGGNCGGGPLVTRVETDYSGLAELLGSDPESDPFPNLASTWLTTISTGG